MTFLSTLLAAFAVGFATLASATTVEPQVDRGNVMVYKELRAPKTKDIVVAGNNFTVTYFVFNLGKGSALNVKVSDKYPSESFDLLEGSAEKTWVDLPRFVLTTF